MDVSYVAILAISRVVIHAAVLWYHNPKQTHTDIQLVCLCVHNEDWLS